MNYVNDEILKHINGFIPFKSAWTELEQLSKG